MSKYEVNWPDLADGEEAGSAIDSVRRYMNATDFPTLEVVLALLEIHEVEEEEDLECFVSGKVLKEHLCAEDSTDTLDKCEKAGKLEDKEEWKI